MNEMIDVLIYWLYIVLVFGIAFIPGFAIATRIKKLDITEKLAISFAFSFLIVVLLTPLFALKLDTLACVLFLLIVIISLFYLSKQKQDLKLSHDFVFLALILIISLVSKFFIQTLWEYPGGGGDWYGHTLIRPYMFNIGDWTPPRDRTPFFNLLIYSYHHLLGTSLYLYWVSQIISVVANSVFILPAYLIAKKVFADNDNIAKVSAAFMIITPFLVKEAIYTWPKNMAMYFALLMIYFMFFTRFENNKMNYALAGFFAALGFLTHNYVLFYIFTALIAFLYVKKVYKKPLTISHELFKNKLLYFFIALIAVIIPYFLWVYSFYGTISSSRFIYYPFAVSGYDAALYGKPQEIFGAFFATPISHIIGIRIFNAVVTLTPAALPINPVATHFHTYYPIFYYSHDYPGALSTLMYGLVLLWVFRYLFRKTKTDSILVMLVVVPVVLYLILYGWVEWGLLTGGLHPSIPILTMLGFNELYKFKAQRIKSILIYLVFVGCLIEDFIYGMLIIKFHQLGGGLLSDVAEGVQRFIPDFQISEFVSAHFLLTGSDFLLNSIISVAIITIAILCYFRFSRSEKFNLLSP